MMNVQILCIGKLKESYWREACAEYAKRLKAFCTFSIVELPESRLPDDPSPALIEKALEEEGEKLLAAAKGSAVIPLCIEGKELSSPQLAQRLEDLASRGVSSVSFIIGSSFGLAERVKRAGAVRLSMSPMTFPHQLARVMLCEQIYRAFQIQNHGKYHK
ncbi:MAG TPA: 23S rRNA (pseudouridine(1915)-N(3))-methyltransferase RlmH [Candidatus Gallacutalibacter pullistercoris]|nr:23S rRNA (pseudouridine(1915)-N(3))-methyltransferase RlmH [Candidatus Gallacutalibacter pullistercoris]